MQFMFGVGGYIIARVLAILLPLFFVNQPGQEDLAIRIVLILENIVLWGFLAALAYIFRSVHFCKCSHPALYAVHLSGDDLEVDLGGLHGAIIA